MALPEIHTNLSPTESVLRTADAYMHGELSAVESIVKLADKDSPMSKKFAAEIALEHAYTTGDVYWLGLSEKIFKDHMRAKNVGKLAYNVHAGHRYAQRKLHGPLVRRNAMPLRQQAEHAYDEMLKLGKDIISNTAYVEATKRADTNGIEMRGAICELAVGILAMRAALQIDSDKAQDEPMTWLPMQSLLSEDHGGNCFAKTGNAWDMNVFTTSVEAAQQSYKVQIKSSNYGFVFPVGDDQDVTLLRVSPDLETLPNERHIQRAIISAAYHERKADVSLDRISPELDQRCEKLLDILG